MAPAIEARRGSVLAVCALTVAVSCGTAPPAASTVRGPAPTRPTPEQTAQADRLLTGPDWYRHAVFYEINVRSFQDSNGDGIGDLAGVASRLDYLRELGVDALWLMPIFPTGFKDSGYDIADYRAIDPAYGDLAAFDRLVSEAHARKLRVFVDLVLNHTSNKHAWFQESRSSKTNAKADWYLWSDTPSRADLGACKPDNALFGMGWSKDETRGQFFFHRFYAEQPDLNYRNPEVVKETLDIARFWLDRGTDGFRCDVIGKLFESPAGCDMLPETIGYIKQLRAVLDGAPGRAMVAEPSNLNDSTPYYGNGSDMFHMTFDFGFGYFWGLAFAGRDKKIIDDAITTSLRYPKGAQPAQVLGSHDVPRAFQYTQNEPWRQRNAALLEMTLRGTPFVYYGEEVGLRPGTQVVVDDRDGARTPMTWTAGPAGHGFTTGAPWIAFGDAPDETAVAVEDADPLSTLTYYRQLLAFRRGHAVWGVGEVRLVALDVAAVVAYVRKDDAETYLVAVNLTDEDQEGTAQDPLPTGGAAVFGEGSLDVGGGSVHVKIPARGGAVFAIK
jgi:alpha-glucosidase